MTIRKKILITGASGFLGGELASVLAHRPDMEVLATSRKPVGRTVGYDNYRYDSGDLCSPEFCKQISQDIHSIVHCAALSAPWGKYADFERANVLATDNLLKAAIKNGVSRFVFISSPSIYVNHHSRYDVKESDPLPLRQVNHYAHTKRLAEQNVLGHNAKGIETLALRPRAIYGAGDTVIFPRLIQAVEQKKLKIIGDGETVCDITGVQNVIHAIIKSLHADGEALGSAYNITNGNPVRLWDVINGLLVALGKEAISKRIPTKIAMGLAGFLEWEYRMFHGNSEPPLTKFGIGVLANSMTLNIDRARRFLDYQPIQTNQQGIDEFITWYRQQNNA